MGIQGLLPALKPIQSNIHISKYKGQRVGVDAYVWLHRGAFSCAFELATGKPTTRFVQFCMKRVGLLQHHGVIPVLVFDGGNLPMKALTEKDRRDARRARKAKGLEYLAKGDTSKATECFQTCIDVTPLMAFEFIKALKLANVEFVVAPYEADSQLAYLNITGSISCVLTEDSDLISFGCIRTLYKLLPDGSCTEILKKDLGNVKEMRFWTHERFRQMCVLSGCDYLANPPGIGVKTAMKLLERTDAYSLIRSWVNWGSAVKAPKLPPKYLESFRLADYTFQFQRVYDAKTQRLVTLNPIPSDVVVTPELMNAIGPDMEPSVARGVAEGLLNPDTKHPYPLVNITARVLKENNISIPKGFAPMIKSSIFKQQQPRTSSSDFFSKSLKQPLPSSEMKLKNIKSLSVNISSNSNSTINNSSSRVVPAKKEPIVIVIDDEVENEKSTPATIGSSKPSVAPSKILQSIRSTHSKIVSGSSSKIVPARRKLDVDSPKQPNYPQKKISSFFGMPRLFTAAATAGQKSDFLADLRAEKVRNAAFAGNVKDSRPAGVLNLLKPPKARKQGLTKKK